MNTEQSYVGRDSHASNLTPEGQNPTQEAQTPPPAANTGPCSTPFAGERQFLRRIIESSNPVPIEFLFDTLLEIDEYFGTTNPIPAISKMMNGWLSTCDIDLNEEENRAHIRAVLTLFSFLVRLKETHECLKLEVDGLEDRSDD